MFCDTFHLFKPHRISQRRQSTQLGDWGSDGKPLYTFKADGTGRMGVEFCQSLMKNISPPPARRNPKTPYQIKNQLNLNISGSKLALKRIDKKEPPFRPAATN